ncbi:MAG: DUF1738 domain-containing protein [Alphaproteobacteria bacterium]|nr:MAG: DUF1738 domain-containing protein [Alphaproteobacteria bacterium]
MSALRKLYKAACISPRFFLGVFVLGDFRRVDSDKPPFDLFSAVTNTILAALDRGVAPWRKPWDTQAGLPCNAQTNRPYRGVNVFLLGLAPYTDHRWLTFRQAQEMGGMVRKGEHSSLVLFWKFPEQDEEDPVLKQRPPVLRYYRVFNAEQVEGLELPPLYVPERMADAIRIERADLLVRSMPDPPKIEERGGSAWYSPLQDLVVTPPIGAFRSADDFYGTLFHELGHSTGHPRRLARAGVCGEIRFGSGTYGKEELVAELTSAFCCATVRLDNSLIENSAAYIQGWLSAIRSDPKAVVYAAAQAQKAADFIKGGYSNRL